MIRGILSQLMLLSTIASCGPNGSIDEGSSVTPKPVDDNPQPNTTADANPTTAKSTEEASFDLTQCGYSLASPSAILNAQQLAMVPTTVNITVPVLIFQSKKEVTINGTFVMESSLSHQTVSYKASPSGYGDVAAVVSAVASATGSGNATLMDVEKRSKIGEINADWAGLFCTLQPAMSIQHQSDQSVTADFSQPVPFGVLVAGDAARIKIELASKRTWSNIVAKVVASTNPAVPVGTAYTGNVIMEPVAVGGGGGDVAVKVTYNFGSAEKNQILGLPSSIIWNIDTAAHTIKTVQVDIVGGKPNTFK